MKRHKWTGNTGDVDLRALRRRTPARRRWTARLLGWLPRMDWSW